MATVRKTGAAVGAHLVGGIKAASAEEAMRAVAGTLGKHVYAITDGETGPRSKWIGWQIAMLTAVEGIQLVGTKTVFEDAENEVSEIPKLAIDAWSANSPAAFVKGDRIVKLEDRHNWDITYK